MALEQIEERAWCGVCTRRHSSAELVGPNVQIELGFVVQILAGSAAQVQAGERRLGALRGPSLHRRSQLLTKLAEDVETVERFCSPGSWTARALSQVPGVDEVSTWARSVLERERAVRLPVSKTLHNSFARAAASQMGLSEYRGVLEEDEVIIAVRSLPERGLASQVCAAYGLARSGAGAVVVGPRFLHHLLVADEGFAPQVLPAPERAVCELAGQLWDPESAGLAALAHAVAAARDVLAE